MARFGSWRFFLIHTASQLRHRFLRGGDDNDSNNFRTNPEIFLEMWV